MSNNPHEQKLKTVFLKRDPVVEVRMRFIRDNPVHTHVKKLVPRSERPSDGPKFQELSSDFNNPGNH
jgi:hypothetical protein